MRLEFANKDGAVSAKVEVKSGDLLRVVADNYAQLGNVVAAGQAFANALGIEYRASIQLVPAPKAEAQPDAKPAPEPEPEVDDSPGAYAKFDAAGGV
jgi:hypothetical protein